MKNLTLTLGLICFSLSVLSAQTRIGVKTNYSTESSIQSSKEYYDASTRNLYGLEYLSTHTGFSYGVSTYKEFNQLWFMTDLLYKKSSVEYRLNTFDDLSREAILLSDTHTELSIPVTAGYKFKNLKIGVGPIFNFKLTSDYELEAYEGFELREKKMTTGFQFLVGYLFKDRFHIDLKRELGFDGSGDNYRFLEQGLKLRTSPKNLSISVGIYL